MPFYSKFRPPFWIFTVRPCTEFSNFLLQLIKSEFWEQNCVWLFYYFDFERNYDVLKSKTPSFLLNKNIKFIKNETESKMENPTHSSRVMHHVLQLVEELRIKSKTVMSLSSWKKKEWISCNVYFVQRKLFEHLRFISMYSIEWTFEIYILLLIKKNYFIYFCSLFLKSSKAFSVSLNNNSKNTSLIFCWLSIDYRHKLQY